MKIFLYIKIGVLFILGVTFCLASLLFYLVCLNAIGKWFDRSFDIVTEKLETSLYSTNPNWRKE